jgi:predicted transcriptional regulator
MVSKNVYIRARDEAVWQRAEQWAEKHDRSLSWVLAKALQEFLDRHTNGPDQADA